MTLTTKQPIIFLDDEDNVLSGLRRTLRSLRSEWEMYFFTRPEMALEKLKTLSSAVVVSDWMMPDMDGLIFTHKARELAVEKKKLSLYIIMLTGKQNRDDAVYALERGLDDYIKKPFHSKELIARIRIGIRLLQGEQALKAANEELQRLATTDSLTGLLNRRAGTQILNNEMSRVARDKQDLSAILLDLDHFKSINDRYGHDGGDAVLLEVANRLKTCFRDYDAVVRWGGEEFLVICPHTNKNEAMAPAERFLTSLSDTPIEIDEETNVRVTVSIGTSSSDTPGNDTHNSLISNADAALYTAKKNGRNQISQWTEDTNK